MNFNDLVGEKLFSGIDFVDAGPNSYGDHYEITYFILDNITYRVEEDPSDGYRSYAMEPEVDYEYLVKNKFEGVEVIAEYKNNAYDEILLLKDKKTNELILEIGTANLDDYYPYYVSSYTPEAMSVNKNG